MGLFHSSQRQQGEEQYTNTKRQSSSNNNDRSSIKLPEDIVLDKVLNNTIIRQKLGNNLNQMKIFAKQLSDIQELKESYLHTDWLQTMNLLKETSNIQNKILENSNDSESNLEKLRKGSAILVSTQSGTDMAINSYMNNNNQNNNNLNNNLDHLPPNMELKDKIRIKLLVTETARNSTDRTIRQLLSPVLDTFNVLPEMGMFHTALIVGPWKLEWNDSGLIVPRKIMSQAAVITADIDYISSMDRLDFVIDNLAKVICKWNVTMNYKQTGGDKSKYGNCQDFVDDCLDALGVKLNFEGSLKNFLTRLRKTGNSRLEFEMTEQFVKDFNLLENNFKLTYHENENTYTLRFDTHRDLDLFVNYLIEKDDEFEMHFKSEYVLLKSFDRAFWVKAVSFPNIPEFQPLFENDGSDNTTTTTNNNNMEDKKHKCPFGDPLGNSFLYI
ncbi:hypothetical protein ABK040_003795 [Willaertia magna]